MKPKNTSTPNKNKLLFIVCFVGIAALLFVALIGGLTLLGRGTSRSNGKAELFITDYLQTDQKSSAVFFANDARLNSAEFQSLVIATKNAVRDGGYTSAPVLIEPTKTVSAEHRITGYKVCKPSSSDCLLIRVGTFRSYIDDVQYTKLEV